jgi:hypothetical protein
MSNKTEGDSTPVRTALYKSPSFQVAITWIWNFVGVFAVWMVAMAFLPPGYPLTNDTLKVFHYRI